MKASTAMRWCMCAALLAACSSSSTPIEPTEDGGADGDAVIPDPARNDAAPAPARELPIEVGSLVVAADGTPGAFTDWIAGYDAPLIWGAQGGIMITPTIRLATGDGWAPGAYRITLAHSTDPDHADRFLVDMDVRVSTYAAPANGMVCPPGTLRCTQPRMIDDRIVYVGLFNQLSTTNIGDSYTVLDVTVEGEGRRGTTRLPLHLVGMPPPGPPPPPAECDLFEDRSMPPCTLRLFSGTGRVTGMTPIEGEADRIDLEYRFAATSPDARLCIDALREELTFHSTVDGSCALEVGDRFEMELRGGVGGCLGTLIPELSPTICSP